MQHTAVDARHVMPTTTPLPTPLLSKKKVKDISVVFRKAGKAQKSDGCDDGYLILVFLWLLCVFSLMIIN